MKVKKGLSLVYVQIKFKNFPCHRMTIRTAFPVQIARFKRCLEKSAENLNLLASPLVRAPYSFHKDMSSNPRGDRSWCASGSGRPFESGLQWNKLNSSYSCRSRAIWWQIVQKSFECCMGVNIRIRWPWACENSSSGDMAVFPNAHAHIWPPAR